MLLPCLCVSTSEALDPSYCRIGVFGAGGSVERFFRTSVRSGLCPTENVPVAIRSPYQGIASRARVFRTSTCGGALDSFQAEACSAGFVPVSHVLLPAFPLLHESLLVAIRRTSFASGIPGGEGEDGKDLAALKMNADRDRQDEGVQTAGCRLVSSPLFPILKALRELWRACLCTLSRPLVPLSLYHKAEKVCELLFPVAGLPPCGETYYTWSKGSGDTNVGSRQKSA